MQTLKLEIDVTPKTFEKIQALGRLTQASPDELTSDIGTLIDQYLDSALIGATQAMLKSLGVDPSLVPMLHEDIEPYQEQIVHSSFKLSDKVEDAFVGFNMPAEDEDMEEEVNVGSLKDFKETRPLETPGLKAAASSANSFVGKAGSKIEKGAPVYLAEKTATQIGASLLDGDIEEDDGPVVVMAGAQDEDLHEFEEDESSATGFEAGPEETEFANMDPELDADDDMKQFLGGDTVSTIKNAQGQAEEFKDDFMNDIQNEFSDDDGEGDFMSEPAPTAKAKVSGVSHMPSDADPDGLDILPQDFGIKSVADDKGAMSFFDMAMEGKTGDKSRRNGVTKKRILMPGDY
jgi:hypothetical protein